MRAEALRSIGIALLCVAAPAAGAADELRNWFNDPFFQVRQAVPACPVPLGPLLTEADRKRQAHYRAERGTTCWMASTCTKPNSYMYDADIAKDVAQRFADSKDFARSSLWITVQRRWVFVEGCVPVADGAAKLEAWLKTVPDVEQVIVNVAARAGGKMPYAVRK